MNKKKLNDAKLRGSIDTLSIVSPEVSAQPQESTSYINNAQTLQNRHGDITLFQYIINPNKTDIGEVYHYQKFNKVMEYILSQMDITHFHKNRVDFRIDSCQDNYNELLKLNKCIILMLSLKYKVKNRYQSFDPLSLDNLTIRIQNQYFEAENYNKGIQEPEGDVKNRLELRSKGIQKDKDIPALVRQWLKRLNDITEYFQELQVKCNSVLVSRWNIEKGNEVKTISEFIRKYQDNIFCRKQLISFFEAVGIDNPVRVADNFKQRNNIEYFSLSDLKRYLKLIEKSLLEYLNNESF